MPFHLDGVFVPPKKRRAEGRGSDDADADDARDAADELDRFGAQSIVEVEHEIGVLAAALILHMGDVDALRGDDGKDLREDLLDVLVMHADAGSARPRHGDG